MAESPRQIPSAFRALRRDLLHRRLTLVEPRLRVEIVLLALLASSFLFWKARIAFASYAHAHGATRVATMALGFWTAIVIATGAWVAARHRRQLGGRAPGPPWLALPLPGSVIRDHLAWEARTQTVWAIPAAPALLAAMVGLVPAWWIPILVVVGATMLVIVGHAACRLAFVLARGPAAHPGLDPVTRRLAVAESVSSARAIRPVRWRRASPWVALWIKDLVIARRPTPVRRRAAPPVAFALASVASWALPVEPALARILAFGFGLLAAATVGEWLIALAGQDPVTAFRVLPVGLGSLWTSRAAWGLLASTALVAAQAVAARALSLPALELLLVWLGGAALAITLLAVHYGITLYPREDVAQRVFSLALAIAAATSLMIPMLGWVTLLTAVVHSGRRLPRWSRLDPTP